MSKKNTKKSIIKEHNSIMNEVNLLNKNTCDLNKNICEFYRVIKETQYTHELLIKLLNGC